MSNTYLIKLTPLDWYFFGGEKTFGEDNAEYFVSSNKLPQQSSILGMLRFQLLKQKGWLFGKGGENASELDIKNLIGEASFSIQKTDEFGKIKSISPVCIYNGYKEKQDRFYIPQALDHNLEISIKSEEMPKERVCLNGCIKNCLVLAGDSYDPKTNTSWCEWRNVVEDVIKEDDIWTSKSQVGIQKTNSRNKEKAFYKQTVLKFKDKFCFAVWVDMEAVLLPDFVFLGAERSCFRMDIELVDQGVAMKAYKDICSESNKNVCLDRLEICGDTYIEDIAKLNSLCEFQISNSIPFRNMEMKRVTGRLKNGYVSYDKNSRFNLLKRGSVLYFKNENRAEILNSINMAHLQMIGYNIVK